METYFQSPCHGSFSALRRLESPAAVSDMRARLALYILSNLKAKLPAGGIEKRV